MYFVKTIKNKLFYKVERIYHENKTFELAFASSNDLMKLIENFIIFGQSRLTGYKWIVYG